MVDRASIPVFKNEPVLVLVLGVLSCGLYLIYWNIKVAEVINAATERQVISQPIAIFSGCCMPVNAYFYYLCGQSLDDIGRITGRDKLSDQSMLLLVLGIFVPMVSAMIVQGHINEIYDGPKTS